jgi:hypothetical protein
MKGDWLLYLHFMFDIFLQSVTISVTAYWTSRLWYISLGIGRAFQSNTSVRLFLGRQPGLSTIAIYGFYLAAPELFPRWFIHYAVRLPMDIVTNSDPIWLSSNYVQQLNIVVPSNGPTFKYEKFANLMFLDPSHWRLPADNGGPWKSIWDQS